MFFVSFSGNAQTDSSEENPEKVQRIFLSGYVKDLVQTGFVKDLSDAQFTNILHTRLNFRYEPGEHWQFRAEMRNRLFSGDMMKLPGFRRGIGEDPGLVNLSCTAGDDRSWCWHGIVDRALVRYTSGQLEITAGRQRINWGINTIWNPNDVFNTYNFFDFDYEERPGCDGLRVQYTGIRGGSMEFAGRLGRNRRDDIAGMLYRRSIGKYDVQATAGYAFERWYAGAGFAGNLRNAGFKGELTAFAADSSKDGAHVVLSSSLDYTFGSGWYLMGSVLYNRQTMGGFAALQNASYLRLDVRHMMPVRYSWAAQLSKQLNPVLSLSFTGIHSPDHNLTVLVPALSYWLAQDWELSFVGQSVMARQLGNFDFVGNNLFLRGRWSF